MPSSRGWRRRRSTEASQWHSGSGQTWGAFTGRADGVGGANVRSVLVQGRGRPRARDDSGSLAAGPTSCTGLHRGARVRRTRRPSTRGGSGSGAARCRLRRRQARMGSARIQATGPKWSATGVTDRRPLIVFCWVPAARSRARATASERVAEGHRECRGVGPDEVGGVGREELGGARGSRTEAATQTIAGHGIAGTRSTA